MTSSRHSVLPLLVAASLPLFLACSSGEDTPGGGAGTGGTGGTGGGAGVGGAGGTAGSAAGTGGGAGTLASGGTAGGGAGGSAGTLASGGTAGGGAGGTAGAAAGTAGNAGSGAGTAGAASGGMSGAAGSAGAAGAASGGMSGTAGAGGASGGAAGAAGSAGKGGSGGSGGAGAFTLTLTGFTPMAGCADDMRDNCTVWPRDLQQYMQGPNMSPAMTWSGAPAGTMSFAISLQDLSNDNAHWILWNLPSSTMMLAADVPDTMMNQASIGTGNGYFGPGSSCNVYEFMVYALSSAMFTPSNPTDNTQVLTQLKGLGSQILGTASVRGRQDFSGNCNP